MKGLTPGSPVSARKRTSITTAGPIRSSSGTISPVWSPRGPARSRPEPGGGTKWVGASKWVPQCSSMTRKLVWYGSVLLVLPVGPSTSANQFQLWWAYVMCPGHVPGSRSDTVSERSTTLAPASDANSTTPPSEPFEVSLGIEAHIFRVADYLGLGVLYHFVDQILRDIQVLEVQRVGNADEARLFGWDAPVAADGCLERLLVASEDHGHLRPLDKRAGNDVGVHGLVFDLVRKAPRSQVGQADPEGVTVRLLADVTDDYVFHGGRLGLLDTEDAEASDHVRVHPRSRVVLAQNIDVEHVYVRDRQSRHHPHVLGEELGLALVDLGRRYRLHDGRLVVGVLDGRHAEEDVARLK